MQNALIIFQKHEYTIVMDAINFEGVSEYDQ